MSAAHKLHPTSLRSAPPSLNALDSPEARAELARVIEAVRAGLSQAPKSLPPWLFYDAAGSRLYEEITELPEYYLTRAERSIFAERADEILAAVARGDAAHAAPWTLVELGAGTATKTQLLVHAATQRQGRTVFMPADVSRGPLQLAVERFAREEPQAVVRPIAGHHEAAFAEIARLREPVLLLFIGSSIGNYDHTEARALLRDARASLKPGDALLLGADRRKDPAVLIRAYDDAAGVTAAFDKNVLVRLNRELGADFQLDQFEHVAVWNDAASRIEMHLESRRAQRIDLPVCELSIALGAGERIHTESSVKYDERMIEGLLGGIGFALEQTFFDGERRFAVYLARAV